jgi:hypothetical protein
VRIRGPELPKGLSNLPATVSAADRLPPGSEKALRLSCQPLVRTQDVHRHVPPRSGTPSVPCSLHDNRLSRWLRDARPWNPQGRRRTCTPQLMLMPNSRRVRRHRATTVREAMDGRKQNHSGAAGKVEDHAA